MTAENVEILKELYEDRLKDENLNALTDSWANLEDNDCEKLKYVKLKSKKIAVLLAIFFGAVGGNRYYIGPTLLGALRLAVSVIANTIITLLMVFALNVLTIIVCCIIEIALLTVYIIEIVWSYEDCKTENYNALVRISNGIMTSSVVEQRMECVSAIVGYVLSFFLPPAGLVCSAVGYCTAKRKSLKNKGLAIAGMIISCVMIAAVSIALIVVL